MRTATVLVSQRVSQMEHGERRDCLDQRVVAMVAGLDLCPVPVPNRLDLTDELWSATRPAAVVLTGGNDLLGYGGDVPERDATEHALLRRAIGTGVPVFGICRGMQLIATFFGARLGRVDGHVATRHPVHGEFGDFETNSFHNWGVIELPTSLQASMHADDGVIEALRHRELPISAIMWHPERQATLSDKDREIIRHGLAVLV